MRKVLAAVFAALFALSTTSVFAAAHMKGEKGDAKAEKKADDKKGDAKKDDKKGEAKK